jgi:hypothetical protein
VPPIQTGYNQRNHYVKTRERVHCYIDGTLALFHGPRKLAEFPSVQKPEVRKPELPLSGLKAMK